jgi:hypothetical protein
MEMRNNYVAKLKTDSILWALEYMKRTGDTDLFPKPFELEAIQKLSEKVIAHVRGNDLNNLQFSGYRTTISPKSTMGFRIATQLHPIDSLITLSIIYEIADDLEKARIPTCEKRVFSFRLKPTKAGQLYDTNYTFGKFRETVREQLKNDQYRYILSTDIADFYPSIYMHDIETSLYGIFEDTDKQGHAKALISLFRTMHANQTHKGIPVGPQISRPIAELLLNDIDKALLDEKVEFFRYVDDYVFPCKSKSEAYRTLALFAQKLFEMRGLKLNESKTVIQTKVEYIKTAMADVRSKARFRKIIKFEELLKQAGVDMSSYDAVERINLNDELSNKIDKLNLRNMLEEELKEDKPDTGLIAFTIMNLARLDDTEVADLLLSDIAIEKLVHRLRAVVLYFKMIRAYSPEQKKHVGKAILKVLATSHVSEVPYNRIWLLDLFASSNEWDNQEQFNELYRKYNDHLTSRKLLLAL